MASTELLDRIARDPDCLVLPTTGQPNIDPVHVVAEDVRAFYDVCGGLIIGRGMDCEVRIVGPDECVMANNVLLGEDILGDLAARVHEELRGDVSWDWYIIADAWNGNYLTIDFGRTHNGRCYEAFWDDYMSVAHDHMPVVAASFTELVERLYEHKGQYWYWLEPGFQP